VHIVHRGKSKRISDQERGLLKRRQGIEPIIGHLKGETGDKVHAVLCAAGYNIQWLLRMIAKKRVTFLRWLYLRLQKLGCLTSLNVLNGFKPGQDSMAWA
jgi:IS5 family transposase